MPEMSLTDTAIKRLQPNEKCTPNKPNKISDGNGLWLYVQHTGTKVFVSIYSHNGKQKEKTSGKYPALSLAQARAKNTEIKKQPAQGIDPKKLPNKPKSSNPITVLIRSISSGWGTLFTKKQLKIAYKLFFIFYLL